MMVVTPEAPLQRLDLVAQVHAHLGVERRERLVEQEQPRRRRERAGERDPLLLAAGQLGGILVALVGKADQLEQLATRCSISARASRRFSRP